MVVFERLRREGTCEVLCLVRLDVRSPSSSDEVGSQVERLRIIGEGQQYLHVVLLEQS